MSMLENPVSLSVWIPDAPSSIVPASTGVMVIGTVELSGVLTLSESVLLLEYRARVAGIGWTSPPHRISIPLTSLPDLKVKGGWWRPRIELRVLDAAALGPLVPAHDACVSFRITRAQRRNARELAAEVALRAAELPVGAPSLRLPGG